MPQVPEPNMDEIVGKIKFEVTPEQTRDIVDNVMAGYKKVPAHPSDRPSDPDAFNKSFSDYVATPAKPKPSSS